MYYILNILYVKISIISLALLMRFYEISQAIQDLT